MIECSTEVAFCDHFSLLCAKFVATYALFLGVKFGLENLIRVKDLTFYNSAPPPGWDKIPTFSKNVLLGAPLYNGMMRMVRMSVNDDKR